MGKIFRIYARQIFDSRGNPTVEVDVITDNGAIGRASVPSGASKGVYEALELRDEGDAYMGKGVTRAVNNVNEVIAPKLLGIDIINQSLIDQIMIELDGTQRKINLGANAILGVSLAVAKAAANELNLSLFRYIGGVRANTLPIPMINIINAGSHSDVPISIQEFMIMPVKAKSFAQSLQMGSEIFHHLKKILHHRNLSTAVGDEGGFAPALESTYEALDMIIEAIENSGYKAGEQIKLALDVAASEFFIDGVYDYTKFEGDKGVKRSSEEQVYYLEELVEKYPIISIEDGMDQNDWEGWKALTAAIGEKVQIVGDDLFVTDVKRLSKGIEEKAGNSILIKVNQVGTLTEAIDAVNKAHNAGFTCIISHRSGETEDNTIADLAVALSTGQIKTGSTSRSDRISKYNQLLRIESELKDVAYYPQEKALRVNL